MLLEGLELTLWLYLIGWGVAAACSVWLFRTLARNPETGRAFWSLLAGSILLRLAWIAYAQPEPVSDYISYWEDARLLAGGDFTYPDIDKHPGVIMLFAAVITLFGHSYAAVWGLNLVLSAILLALVFDLTRQLFDRRAACLALILAGLQPQLINYTALMATELPTLVFLLMLPWAALQSREHDPWLLWVGMGWMLYTAVLTRSTTLLFLGLIPLVLLVCRRAQWKTVLRHSLVMGATAGVLLGTWLGHQYLLAGEAKLFWGGELWLHSTAQYETEGRFVGLKGMDPALEQTLRTGNPRERKAALEAVGRAAQAKILADPGTYLRMGLVRMKHMLWTTSETGLRDVQHGSAVLQAWPGKAVTRLAELSKHLWRILLLVSLLGWLTGFGSIPPARREGLLMIGGFMAIWLIFHYLMAVASDRWTVQLIPYVCLLAAGGITCVQTWLVRQPATAPTRA